MRTQEDYASFKSFPMVIKMNDIGEICPELIRDFIKMDS